MNVTLLQPAMTRNEFLDWLERQERRFEFDGSRPVAMVGGTLNHSTLTINILFALRSRLQGTSLTVFGPDAGVATIGNAVRYPDALVTATPQVGTDRLVTGSVVVFEAISPSSGRNDRIIKVREYAAVPTIRRYVTLEHTSMGLTAYSRAEAGQGWTVNVLMADDTLGVPEIGVEIPVRELYAGTGLPETEPDEER